MIKQKNALMTFLSFSSMLISFFIHFFNRVLNIFNHPMLENHEIILNIFLVIPILTFVITLYLYNRKKNDGRIPFFNMLTLTFSSMSIIAGGIGMVEYHFSIFMVIAILAYYEDINLIVTMTILFAIQHITGLYLIPDVIFGEKHYSFGMVALHASFLVFTSGATILQIMSKKKYTLIMENEKKKTDSLIKDLIQQLSENSQLILNSSTTLSNSTNTSVKTNDEIVTSMLEVANGARSQLIGAEETSKSMSEMSLAVQQIAETFSKVSESSRDMSEQANEGYSFINQAISQMDSVISSAQISADVVKKLDEHSRKIGQIVEVITKISADTNLLALNAAIEAARAGEHGKGFSVVSDEVRKLAEQSSQSAAEIEVLIKQIQEDTNLAVESFALQTKEVLNGKDIVDKSGYIFKDILQATNKVVEDIEDLTALTEEMAAESEEISAYIDQMVGTAKKSSLNSEQVLTITNQQIASVKENSNLADSLKILANKLEELIKRLYSQQ